MTRQRGYDIIQVNELTNYAANRPADIDPHESRLVRAALGMASPAWLTAAAVLCAGRAVRRELPLLVLHERVGYGRSRLLVPKIATASMASNQRRLGGLIEMASGPPEEVLATGSLERWLRSSGLDELPQLALIVAGKMRFVGPRPVTPDELDEMLETGDEVGIDVVRPGIVGLWQVLDRHEYTLAERRSLDIRMIDNWSSSLQRKLVLRSFAQALRRLLLLNRGR